MSPYCSFRAATRCSSSSSLPAPTARPIERVQHRGVPAGLQLRLVLAREHPVLPGEQARTVHRALHLLVVGVLDVGDPLTHLRERLTVTQPPGVNGRVDREPDGLQRREQRLRGGAGELGCVRERAEREHRLVRAALLAVHDQGLLALGDRRVRAAAQVMAERLKRHTVTGVGDHERVRLPIPVQLRLGDPAARRRDTKATEARSSSRAARG